MSFKTLGFEDLEKELKKIADIENVAPQMLEAAVPVLEENLKGEVQSDANKGFATGELYGSLSANKPEENKYGHYVSVTAKGVDSKGVRNNEKLAYMEYGTSKQEATAVISKAVRKSEKKCHEIMQEKFEEVTGI